MMTQNRLSDVDREHALADYQVNIRAEAEIALAARDLGWPPGRLDEAGAVLEAHGDRANAREHLARQTGNARRFGAKLHRPGVVLGIGHDDGLPSVRTILTVCCCLPLPRRSSAAPNRRSTIRMLW